MTNEKILLQLEKGYDIKNPQLAQALSNLEDKIGITKAELEEAIETKANLVGGKVPAEELPSYVDDVIEFNGLLDPSTRISTIVGNSSNKNRTYFVSGSDPNSGRVGSSDKYPYMFVNFGENTSEEDWISGTPERGKIYLNISNDHSYRWTGSELLDLDKNWSTAIVGLSQNTIRTDTSQDFSTERENQALSNIGSGLFVVDLIDGKATLTADQEAKLLSSSGVILRGTINAGKEVLTKIYFPDYQEGDQVSFWAVRNNRYILQCIYTKSTKLFQFLTSGNYIDLNAVSTKPQTLTGAQQAQAFKNLGMTVYVTDSSFLGSTLSAEEIEQVAASKVLLFTDTGDLFLFGSQDSNRVSFYQFSTFIYVNEIRISKSSGLVSGLGSYAYMDKNALHFTAQSPALTSAQQSQVFENLGWKVHVISESAISSSDAVSDDEKAARLSATALLVQETGLLYNFSISSGGNRRFYGQFSSSFCTALNVNEATGVITSSFAYLYDPSAVSFDRNQSSVSDDNKNKALGNIGIDLVRIPYSLLGTTLSDNMFAVVDNARGIILVDTPSDYSNPTVFIKGNNVSGSCIFVSFVTGNTYCIFTLNKSTKLLSGINSGLTYGGSVRYAEDQSLTDTQKSTARSNIGVQSADELLADDDFIAQLKTKLGIE